MSKHSEFIEIIKESIANNEFVRLTFSKPIDKSGSLKKVLIKLAMIKKKLNFSIVYRHETKDITKNFVVNEGYKVLLDLMENTLLNAVLFTTKKDVFLEANKKGNIRIFDKKPTFTSLPEKSHDKKKNNWITNDQFLVELGILDGKGRIQKDKGDKFKQINKFVEIIDNLIKKTTAFSADSNLTIYDMGSGKGYLTFALYDYITNIAQINCNLIGVEIRPDLVQLCNDVAANVGFEQLFFQEGLIQNFTIPTTDILIALHACDTATDDAIQKGIGANAELIICAPCCHKQIRKEFNATAPLDAITNHGILKERQAEVVTDTIRALLLEANGYKASVFEFISTEHTGKNVMIVGQKHQGKVDTKLHFDKIKALKETFGIKKHYLESIL